MISRATERRSRRRYGTIGQMSVLVHGVDIVEVDRIRAMLDEHGQRFIERCFTEAEQEYSHAAPKRQAERFAARFAAKEAVLKALGTGWRNGISWRDIGVVHVPSGQPQVVLSGRCAEIASQLGVRQWCLSLSHTERMAMASVVGSNAE